MGEFFKGWRRKAGLATLAIVFVFIAYTGLQGYCSLPFTTANHFVNCIRNGQFEKAKSMIDPADQARIPHEYWEQFRGRESVLLSAPTPLVFINRRMAIKVVQYDGPAIDIRYEVSGSRIRVAAINGELSE